MEEGLWLIFSIGALVSGLLVISSTNPIHSIFALVLAFCNSSFLLLMLGVEFLGFLLMIVYVGAIAILFLFVVMMLNVRLVEIMDNATRYVPAGLVIGLIFLLQLLLIMDEQFIHMPLQGNSFLWNSTNWNWMENIYNWVNITLLGNFLYTEGWVYFLISGMVLFVAMIGAIVLTLHHEQNIKRQDIFSQIVAETDSILVFKNN